MNYLLIILMGYLIGCSNMAYYLGKRNKVDIQKSGSGNLGASNATVLLGWGAGVLVAVHDIAKAVLAVFLAQKLFPDLEYAGVTAGVASVMGHIFPFYLKFKGGKGLASFVGMTLMLNWKVGLAAMVLVALITLITDYISLGTLTVSVAVPVAVGLFHQSMIQVLILLIATAVIFVKHWENILRIRNGTEIGLRSTAKGENRVK